ncbi:hypothetical protein [Zooshikella sp. RANM57]
MQGNVMTITGQLPPCNSCKGYMNRIEQLLKQEQQ